jgi:hypothetical protein
MKIFAFILLFSSAIFGASFPKVDQDIQAVNLKVSEMKAEFAIVTPDPQSSAWIKLKINHMFQVDQFVRKCFLKFPAEHSYTPEEKKYFLEQNLLLSVDSENTLELKKLLNDRKWFKISEFGEKTDSQAWLLVQHADHDSEFQKNTLSILSELFPIGETDAANYAYLFDRIAASWNDLSKRTLQRYATQGNCISAGNWQPIPMEDPANVEKRRAEVGLLPLSEYIKKMNSYCL